jgi:hypothetical protein
MSSHLRDRFVHRFFPQRRFPALPRATRFHFGETTSPRTVVGAAAINRVRGGDQSRPSI